MNVHAERLQELADQTDIPLADWIGWIDSEPPAGISKPDWIEALAEAAGADPLSPEAVRELQWLAAPGRHANAA